MNKGKLDAHRGYSAKFPENTMLAFHEALKLDIDMVEMDVHMTSDGEIVLMHDHKALRTAGVDEWIYNMTKSEFMKLDAGAWKGEQFRGTPPASFDEFLELMATRKDLEICLELKDYPSVCGDRAYESADKTIDMVIKAGLEKNIIVNSFSGEILRHVDDKYDGFFPLHGYYPPSYLGEGWDESCYDSFKNLKAVCLFNKTGDLDDEGGSYPVVAKKYFDMLKSKGIDPWVYYRDDLFEYVEKAVSYGAVAVTSNDPVLAAEFLRKLGVRD